MHNSSYIFQANFTKLSQNYCYQVLQRIFWVFCDLLSFGWVIAILEIFSLFVKLFCVQLLLDFSCQFHQTFTELLLSSAAVDILDLKWFSQFLQSFCDFSNLLFDHQGLWFNQICTFQNFPFVNISDSAGDIAVCDCFLSLLSLSI